MGMLRKISGLMNVELTSANVGEKLARFRTEDIVIFQLTIMDELTCSFWITETDYGKTSRICDAQGDRLGILKRSGIYHLIRHIKRRPVLIMGILLAIALNIYLPSRVLFVRVEGNCLVPEKRILAAAENCGIEFGARRKDVRSERMKNALLSEIEELQWVGINTAGCVAVISVRERSPSDSETLPVPVASIVAARDGYLLSCTALRGNLS